MESDDFALYESEEKVYLTVKKVFEGQSPLADPLVAALFQHHSARVPAWLRARLLPVPVSPYHQSPRVRFLMKRAEKMMQFRDEMAVRERNSVLRKIEGREKLKVILGEVCAKHDMPIHGVISQARTKDLIRPRLEFYYLAADKTLLSYMEIGRFIGRDHSTVINGISRWCKLHNLPHPRSTADSMVNRAELKSRYARERRKRALLAAKYREAERIAAQ